MSASNEHREEKIFLLWSDCCQNFGTIISFLAQGGWRVEEVSDSRVLGGYASNKTVAKFCVCLAIFNLNENNFSSDQIKDIEVFCEAGNHLIVASSDPDKVSNQTSLNELVKEHGVEFQRNSVIRPNMYKHFHPKEANLEDFIVNRGFGDHFNQLIRAQVRSGEAGHIGKSHDEYGIVYAYGCTLQVREPSVVVMTTSKWAIPTHQAICCLDRNESSKMRFIAIGSAAMFCDSYVEDRHNKALFGTLLEFITNRDFHINVSDARTIEIPELNYAPDMDYLSNIPMPALQEPEPLPDDKSELIDERLFNLDNSALPKIVKAYQKLGISREPLSLIKPQFECKSLDLEPATHNYILRTKLLRKMK